MTRRTFTRVLRSLSTRRTKRRPPQLDPAKIAAMDPALALQCVQHLVSRRAPLVLPLVERSGADRAWLAACAYFHTVQGNTFAFLCTDENRHLAEPTPRPASTASAIAA